MSLAASKKAESRERLFWWRVSLIKLKNSAAGY